MGESNLSLVSSPEKSPLKSLRYIIYKVSGVIHHLSLCPHTNKKTDAVAVDEQADLTKKGSQLGKLVLSSGLLDISWSKISELHASSSTNLNKDPGLVYKIFYEANHTFVVFVAPPIRRNSYDSTRLDESQDLNPFRFLCSEKFFSFSVYTPAFQLFSSAYDDLYGLKSELLMTKKMVIITGAALGGSVASLFTLWLLEAKGPRQKKPLCITFGSPLIGDASLQHILETSMRESCFLHVVDAAQSPITAGFEPFGTFLICFDSECICINDPEAVVELLVGHTTDRIDWIDYGEILQRLIHSSMADSRPMSMIDDVFDRMEERTAKKKMLNADLVKRINALKIQMVYMDYYRKLGKKNKIGYYDHFKTQIEFPTMGIFNVKNLKRSLDEYWKSVVEDAEEISKTWIFKSQFIHSGANYRRLIEPLDIAEYYLNGGKDYRTLGRSHHYVMLEKWFGNVTMKPNRGGGSDLSELLTFDSCFWAEVEEALIVINMLKTHAGMKDEELNLLVEKLVRFEEYVWNMIKNREVSPDIFLERSSFMKWWKEYKEIKGSDEFNSSSSPFTKFMNTGMYQSYGLPSPNLGNDISGSATGPPPGPSDRLKSSVDKEEGQKVVHLKLHLRNDEETTKALNTIAKISGVSSVVADGYERFSVTWNGTMDPVELVKELSKYWPAEIISVGSSKKIQRQKESSEEALKGSQLGKLVLTSGLLQSSWSKISEIHASTYPNQDSALGFKIFREAKCTFVVFATPPIFRNSSFNSASTLLPRTQYPNPFPFLCSEHISSFSVHTPAFELFTSAYEDLSILKDELLQSKKPVIITGAALGGSVASLFTLWLLETVDPRQKHLLCITFGSPLIGDASLQQILENSVRNACFLHVADPAQTAITAGFKPFGKFLICFDSGCICIEDPEAVMELLTGVNTDLVDYGEVLHRLGQSVLSMADPILIPDDVIDRMEERAKQKKLRRFDPSKKLKDMRTSMSYIEWYKKKSKEEKIGYYDRFKTQTVSPTSEFDIDIKKCKKELNDYWKSLVEELEKKPQSDLLILSGRFLFSGNNYRQLVEPLDIAEYYIEGGKEYLVRGRSRHYVMLQKWFQEESLKPIRDERRDLSDLLMFDSCFWAEVEETLIVINLLKRQVEIIGDDKRELLIRKLVRFEEYVWNMIKNREVSPDIFLERSSFMKWWKEYKEIKRSDPFNSSSSPFTEFMNTGMYHCYGLSSPNLGNDISGSATGPLPGPSDRPKSSVDKEEGQKVVHLKLHLRDDEEKTKALSTIAKISGVSSVVADGYERFSVTWNGTMDPVVLVKELSKYWPAEIISVGPSKKFERKKESSEERPNKQIELSVKTQKIKDEESVLSSDSGSGSIIATDTGILVFSCNGNDVDETLFIEAILNGLHRREVTPLKYNLSGRESLDPEMLYSSVGIMVLSNSFARSSQSLDHLVAIMEHWKAKHLVIIPVYIKVTPSDICRLEDWVEASVQLQYLNSVQKWKAAMIELASIDGHQWAERTQFTLAEEVARDAWLYLKNCKNVVRILALLKHSQPSDAEIVGIWGMAGIGKTSIAREIFGILAPEYHSTCILEDFYLLCQKKGLRQMRDDFFSKVFGEENLSSCDIKPSFMREWFLNKKILVVLDGVSNARDAEYVVGGFGWFSRGHRIILTSRRKQVLVQCKAEEPYEINKLCEFESIRLCKQFFNGGKSGIISELIYCSSGIPLALEVLGSSVSKEQHIKNMKLHLQSLRIKPPIQMQEAFERSFDGLDENEKNIFLDLACFFGGENKDYVVQLLDACGLFTSSGIYSLIDESLISLLDDKIEIPIPFQDMGRFIVQKKDDNPCERSRLWDSKDIIAVLTKNSGTEAIEGIFLDTSDLTCDLSPTVFCEMDRLRLLKFYRSTSGKECKLNLPPQGLEILPDELRLLHWEHYSFKYLPQKFDPENLVEINMPYSDMEKLWEGKKNLEKLKKIKLSHSSKLTDILVLSEALNLEHIDLEGCTSLVDISTSIPRCGKLISMNMKDCSHLRSLPAMVDLTYLKLLNLSGCSDLKEIQDCAPNLKELFLAESGITKLPLSIANLTELVTLDLKNCTRLQQLPSRIRKLRSKIDLNTSGCTSLPSFPEFKASVMMLEDFLTQQGISVYIF
ncbi:unnamed protein product [Arabis nemorensis]|uniref:TIR domain-containing protein n=1 Tax=Arabis nemorensis TaxID=586526 RepID=A0A565CFZ0_9BRAS|nr:unnamed protein product [Arabis nemorensis]